MARSSCCAPLWRSRCQSGQAEQRGPDLGTCAHPCMGRGPREAWSVAAAGRPPGGHGARAGTRPSCAVPVTRSQDPLLRPVLGREEPQVHWLAGWLPEADGGPRWRPGGPTRPSGAADPEPLQGSQSRAEQAARKEGGCGEDVGSSPSSWRSWSPGPRTLLWSPRLSWTGLIFRPPSTLPGPPPSSRGCRPPGAPTPPVASPLLLGEPALHGAHPCSGGPHSCIAPTGESTQGSLSPHPQRPRRLSRGLG